MAFIGAFAVLMVIYFRLDKYQVPFDVFVKYFFASVIGGFLGSKLLFAITQIPELIADFSVENLLLLIPQSGFVFYGGLFGVLTTVLLFGIFELKRIPVQMIESVYEFFLCVVIFAAEKNKKMDGLKLYLTAYGIFRFVIEFFRGDAVRGIFLGMSTAQWISLFILGYYLGKRFFTM